MLASVSESLKVWQSDESQGDQFRLQLLNKVELPNEHFHSLSWNHTNQVIALGGKQPKINLIQANSGQLLSTLVLSESKLLSNPIKAMEFSSNSRFIACAVGAPVQLWDLKRRQIKSVFTGHIYPVVSVSFTPDGDLFTGDCYGNIKLWNSKSNLSVLSINATNADNGSLSIPPEGGLTCMKYSAPSSLLLSGFNDGFVRIYDFSSQEILQSLREQQLHSDRVTAMTASPKNSKLVTTASLDQKLLLIDTSSKFSSNGSNGVCGMVQTEHRLTSLAFHENGLYTAAGTEDGYILVYDWRHVRRPISSTAAHHPNAIHQLQFQVKQHIH